jgi:nucleotide-binding universal stress UspA family protein
MPIAKAIALATGAELTLLHVVAPDAQPGVTRGPTAALASVAAELRAAGLTAHVRVRSGDVAEVILKLITDLDVDLVAMATHGRTGVERILAGSVADKVLAETTTPLLLLHTDRPVSDELKTILVPVDGTPGGTVALSAAIPVAMAARARLKLVQVAPPLPLWIEDPTLGLDSGPLINLRWNDHVRAVAEQFTERLARELREAGIEAEGQAVVGADPARSIARVADEVEADMIVMSTHAYVGPVRTLLGSVANGAVRRSQRPVLLVRRVAVNLSAADEKSVATGQAPSTP